MKEIEVSIEAIFIPKIKMIILAFIFIGIVANDCHVTGSVEDIEFVFFTV